MSELPELPPGVAELVAQAREEGRPNEADRRRVWSALSVAIGTGTPAAPPASHATPHAAPTAAGALTGAGTKGMLAKVVASVALAGAVGGAASWYAGARSHEAPAEPGSTAVATQTVGQPEMPRAATAARAPELTVVAAPAPAAPVAPVAKDEIARAVDAPVTQGHGGAPSATSATPATTPATPRHHARALRVRPAQQPATTIAPSASAATVAQAATTAETVMAAPPAPVATPTPAPVAPAGPGQELQLIRGAQAALRDGAPARALALLDEHAARFGARAILAEERAGLRVLALCASSQRAEGLLARTRFLARTPNSPMAARVRDACGNDDE